MLVFCPLCSYWQQFQRFQQILNKHIVTNSGWACILKGLEKMQGKVISISNDLHWNVFLGCFANNAKNFEGCGEKGNMPYFCTTCFFCLARIFFSILKACKNVFKKLVPCILGVGEWLK